jgi:hypothetical protein
MFTSHQRVFSRLFVLLFCLLPLLAACNLPAAKGTEENGDTVETSAAETIQANALQNTVRAQEALLTAQAQTLQAPLSASATPQPSPQEPSPQATNTEPLPSLTPLPPTFTPLPTFTWTPIGPPRIVANIETNCRTGPSPDYPRVGYLGKDEESTVYGRNESSTWWYIANLRKPGEYCWVWGDTTVVTGDIAKLPVLTPPPPPNPNFSASFNSYHDCGGVPTLVFWVKNTGGKVFRSSSITIKDMSTNTFFSGPETSNSPFLANASACAGGSNHLDPGSTAFLSKGLGLILAPGTQTRAIIDLCTEANQGGDCIEVKVNFNFP